MHQDSESYTQKDVTVKVNKLFTVRTLGENNQRQVVSLGVQPLHVLYILKDSKMGGGNGQKVCCS